MKFNNELLGHALRKEKYIRNQKLKEHAKDISTLLVFAFEIGITFLALGVLIGLQIIS
jgi:hypothetical protein